MGKGFICLVILLTCLSMALAQDAASTQPSSVEYTWHDEARNRDVPVKIYYPSDANAAVPVIIFSHGLGGSREGYGYLGNYWAAYGFISVHLQHIGSDDAVWKDTDIANAYSAMKQAANFKNGLDRCKDVKFAIDQLEKLNADESSPLKGRMNLKKIGMSGHSFGAATTMVIAGQAAVVMGKPIGFSDPRVTCAIAMSAPAPNSRASYDAAFAQIRIPVFMLTGTEDNSPIGKTTAADRRVGFDHITHAPVYLLTFDGGDHMLFAGKRRGPARATDDPYHQLILEGTTAFWDAYLLDDPKALAWFKNGGYAQRIGTSGIFESKAPSATIPAE